MHTYFDLKWIEIVILAAVLACKASKKDRSITEAMMRDDIDLASRAQYTAIQTIKSPEIEGYGQRKVSFWR